MPKDFKLNGKSENLTVQVAYDTMELYGKVTATRQITVKAE